MSVIDRIENTLRKNSKTPGIAASKLAKAAKTDTANVYRRIYDLRECGLDIYSNRKNGKTYYRLAV